VQRLYYDLVLANEKLVERHFPVWDMEKHEMLAWAGLTGEDLRYTVTCNQEQPDGTCYKCVRREQEGIPV
jgi:7-cyano-7-deazaguanine synthase in queuosine biosynthesis